MILRALHELAVADNLIDDPDFEVRPVAWLVEVDRGGRLVAINGTHYEEPQAGNRRPRRLVRSFRVPRRRTGRSGTKAPPDFLVDNAKYVFGVGTPDKPVGEADGREKSGWFRIEVEDCLAATGDEGVKAVLAFLQQVARDPASVRLPAEVKSNDLFAFVYSPDVDRLVHERPAVVAYWRARRTPAASAGNSGRRCVVTGQPIGEPGLFPLVKKIPGATTSGGSLVGFNARAFESFGLDGNENAPISREVAEACATALTRLVDPDFRRASDPDSALPRWHVRLGGDTILTFWSRPGPNRDFVDILAALLEADDPRAVGGVYQSIWRGTPIELTDTSPFYALLLSGAQGRIIVRDWLESTVDTIAANVAKHFRHLEVVRNTPPAKGMMPSPWLPMKAMIGALAPSGDPALAPAPLLAGLVGAALRGTPYPMSLMLRALERERAEAGRGEWADLERRDARAAIIKAVLIRRFDKELSPAMDPTNRDPGYLLGRLMAVLERLQDLALDDINAGVVDRYFGAASATPVAVFPRLLKGARHHARKAKDDDKKAALVVMLDRQVDEICAALDVSADGRSTAGFPAFLPLDQQGLFMLGYHQQRHWLWLPKEERDRVTPSRQPAIN